MKLRALNSKKEVDVSAKEDNSINNTIRLSITIDTLSNKT